MLQVMAAICLFFNGAVAPMEVTVNYFKKSKIKSAPTLNHLGLISYQQGLETLLPLFLFFQLLYTLYMKILMDITCSKITLSFIS